MQEVLIGRQPIYDDNLNVYAYELLFRASQDQNTADFSDGDKATTQVVVNAFIEIGLDKIVGNRPAFFNMTRNFLLSDNPLPFSGEQLVLEVLEDVKVDEELVAAVKCLSNKGFTIALDDFIFHDSLRPLVEVSDIVKIDILPLNHSELKEHVTELRRYDVKLLAEKVETQEEYEFCKSLGFDYYQGYFFCKPRIIKGQSIPSNKLAVLRVLAKLNEADVDAAELEAEISQDVTLSYRLLRTIYSAFFALPRKVDSIRQAVAFIGNQATKNWATLIALAGIVDKPNELMTTAMTRAKFCEQLADTIEATNLDVFFTVGLFSALDALVGMSMDELLKELPLSEGIVDALLHHEGRPGEALFCALAYERGDWDNVKFCKLSDSDIATAYMTAMQWADQSKQGLRH
jgi:EAL and modified HD-GYP domain-containing signal transduction protein